MKPTIGQPVGVYGGLENSLSEHAGVVTFVHKTALSTLHEQLAVVNTRVFLDSHVADKVLKAIPCFSSRDAAIEFNARGGGHAAFLLDYAEPEDAFAIPYVPEDNLGSIAGFGQVSVTGEALT